MTGLLDGIKSKFAASLVASITGDIHAGEAPEGTATPYCLFHVIAPGFGQAYSGASSTTHETVQVQFDVIGEGFRAVGVLCEAVAAAYRAGVTASAGANYHTTQVTACLPDPEPLDKSETGADVWRWSVTTEFAVC